MSVDYKSKVVRYDKSEDMAKNDEFYKLTSMPTRVEKVKVADYVEFQVQPTRQRMTWGVDTVMGFFLYLVAAAMVVLAVIDSVQNMGEAAPYLFFGSFVTFGAGGAAFGAFN